MWGFGAVEFDITEEYRKSPGIRYGLFLIIFISPHSAAATLLANIFSKKLQPDN